MSVNSGGNNYFDPKNVQSDNCIVDKSVIFRKPQHGNFAENYERLVKPSTLKKINTEKIIKLTQISRKHQMLSDNVFGSSNSCNSRFNVTNFNYLPQINVEENCEITKSRRNIIYNISDSNNKHNDSKKAIKVNFNKRLYNSQIYNDNNNSNCKYLSDVNYSNINTFELNSNNNIHYKNKQTSILKDNCDKNLNFSVISDECIKTLNKKDLNLNGVHAEQNLISRRFRGRNHSIDQNCEFTDISMIQLNNGHKQSSQMGLPIISNNNISYLNSYNYNNESQTTNLENYSNFNFTEVDKNINSSNNNIKNILVGNNNLEGNLDNNHHQNNHNNNVENCLNKGKSTLKIVKISPTNNAEIQGEAVSNKNNSLLCELLKTKPHNKNNFNKLSSSSKKNIKTNQTELLQTKNLNQDLNGKIAAHNSIIPFSVNSANNNLNVNIFSNNHYENFKNSKKNLKAFKVIAPMMISSIPRYDM